ncbi:LamG domain-containing protein [Candidatus Dojkabacteria bacterium]|jgi:hypothetical protein|nr:LamG domain-containing protein [Candidatus Dojkabacteria bacterium]
MKWSILILCCILILVPVSGKIVLSSDARQVLNVISSTGNESILFDVDIQDTTACLVPKYTKAPIEELPLIGGAMGELFGLDTVSFQVDGIDKEFVKPTEVKVRKLTNDLEIDSKEQMTVLTESAKGFCYTFKPTDKYLKFGEESIVIASDASYAADTYVNVTQESAFVHLNISNELPYSTTLVYQPFDIYTSGGLQDYSKYSNDLAYTANTSQPSFNDSCIYGNCLKFDGTNDYMSFGNTESLNLSTNFTVSMWLRVDGNGSLTRVAGKFHGSTATQRSWVLSYDGRGGGSGQKLTWSVYTSDGTTTGASATSTMTLGRWYHVVGLYNGSSASIYIDGNHQESVAKTGIVNKSTMNTVIGAASNGVNYFNGTIDDFMIINRSLTPSEIIALNNSGAVNRTMSNGYFSFTNLNLSNNASHNRANVSFSLGAIKLFRDTNISIQFNDGPIVNISYPALNYTNYTLTGSPTYQNFTVYEISPSGLLSPIGAGDITIDTYTEGGEAPPEPPVDTEYPQFYNYTVNPSNNSQYGFNQYNFSYSVNRTNGTRGIEFNGVNYTGFNLSRPSLTAGTYSYYFWSYGNGTDHLYNKSITYSYTINKNSTTTLTLSRTSPIEYPASTDFSGSGCPSQLSCSLNISNGIYQASTIYGNYSSAGNTNYSATSTVASTIINKNSSLSLVISRTTPITYGTVTDFVGSGCPTQLSCSLNISNAVYQAGTIYANYSSAGNANYSASSTVSSIIIDKATPTLTFLANGGTSNLTLELPQQLNISARANNGTLNLEKDGLNYSENNSINVTFPIGNYLFRANITGGQNFTDVLYAYYNISINIVYPTITIDQPTNTTYRDLYQLNYSLNTTITDNNAISSKWYSINGGSNITFTSNTTLTNLIAGSNTLIVYANDTGNNLNSSSVTFYLSFTPKINFINVSNSTTSYSSEGFNQTGLVGWYKLDKNWSTQEDSVNNQNLTVLNNAIYTDEGQIGGGYLFLGGNQNIAGTLKTSINLSQGFAFAASSLWDGDAMAGTGRRYVTYFSGSGTEMFIIYRNASGTMQVYCRLFLNNTCDISTTAINNPSSTNFKNFICSYTGSTLSFYADNTLIGNSSISASCQALNPTKLITTIKIGGDGVANQTINGTLDEIKIWNRSLSSTEVQQLYSITNPTFQENANVTTQVNVTDEDSGDTHWYSWLVDNVEKFSGYGQKVFNWIFNRPSQIVKVNINDSSNYNVSQSWNVSLNLRPPVFTTIPTLNVNYTQSIQGTFIAIDETAISTYSVNDSRFSITSGGVLTNNTQLGAGTYSLNVSVNDSFNKVNSTILTATVNKIHPSMSISGTASIVYGNIAGVSGIETNTGDSDITYTLHRDNELVTNPDTTILGVNTYTYKFNSTEGQNYTVNNTLATFLLTVTKATSTVNAFINHSQSNFSINGTALNIYLNASLVTGTGNLELYLNGLVINNGSTPRFNVSNLSTGNFTVLYRGNVNYTADSKTWFINNITQGAQSYPQITLHSPEDESQDQDSIVRFIYRVSSTNSLANCSLLYNSNRYSTMAPINNALNVFEVVGIEANHPLYSNNLLWSVACTDIQNNQNQSTQFHVDTKPDVTSGGGTQSAKNPFYVNFQYSNNWEKGSEGVIHVQAYNTNNQRYLVPVNISTGSNIVYLSSLETPQKELLLNFKVLNAATVGQEQIKIILSDERTIEYTLKINITEQEVPINEPFFVEKYLWWFVFGIVGMLILIVAVLMIQSLSTLLH